MFKFIIMILLCSSCAKVSYLWNQGVGQLQIQKNSRPNNVVLEDETVEAADKHKIRLIQEYKDYFYRFFSEKPTDIYTETTFLPHEAVTYLVIASPYNTVRAKEECFWFVGCFPYLGFFDYSHAKNHALELQNDGFETYIRPVYAYSSLGYFEDRILSSFFYFEELSLAELIFHELFHTIFFIKDEVELNEALANFFAAELLENYFQGKPQKLTRFLANQELNDKLRERMVDYTKKLNLLYDKTTVETKEQASFLRKKLFEEDFKGDFKSLCKGLDKCFPLDRKWNNASLAAYLTYENDQGKIQSLKEKTSMDLKGFLEYLRNKYEDFKRKDPDDSFSDYLFQSM